LRLTDEVAWRAAHSRLYDHLRETTHEGETPTLADLAPLYRAVAHGCRAGRHQEALIDPYWDRICRRLRNRDLEFYSRRKLGAVDSDLAAISWFFDKPFEAAAPGLSPRARAWVFGYASAGLRAQGRLSEALSATHAALLLEEARCSWANAAIVASNLSETELLIGEIPAAAATAERSVALADRAGDEFRMESNRTTHAEALFAAGDWERAAGLFAEAERRQLERVPEFPFQWGTEGYLHCDMLLSRGRPTEAQIGQRKPSRLRVRTISFFKLHSIR
jgi:hypothetical protein